MRLTANKRGTLRYRHIGDGRLRELMAEASEKERSGDLLKAAADWSLALNHIDPSRPFAMANEEYIKRRLHYCRVWGLRSASNKTKE